jgi:hypothetical protein
MILALVSAFTLPKVYQVYQKPIDQAHDTAAKFVNQALRQVMEKVPFLNKKKQQ